MLTRQPRQFFEDSSAYSGFIVPRQSKNFYAPRVASADGTTSAPGFTFADDPDSGLYRQASNYVGCVAGGKEIFAWQAASPFIIAAPQLSAASGSEVLCQLKPTINQSGTASYNVLEVDSTESSTGSGTKHLVKVGGDSFVVEKGGKVGIGTTGPGSKLHIYKSGTGYDELVKVENPGDPGAGSTRLVIGNSVSEFLLQAYGSGAPGVLANAAAILARDGSKLLLGAGTGLPVQLYSNNQYDSSQFTLATDSNVGIGTAGPNARLHVDQSSGTGAVPVLLLDQADDSEEMIEFTGTVGVGNAIEAVGTKTLTTTHFIKVTITGVGTRYIPVGTIA